MKHIKEQKSEDDTDYIYIVTVLVVTNSLCGFVVNQVWYNLESAEYLIELLYNNNK